MLRIIRIILFCTVLVARCGLAQTPAGKQGFVNVFPASSVTGGKLRLDGELGEWKSDAFLTLFADEELRERFAMRVALAWDDKGLLLAARFTDDSPMQNKNDPAVDPFRGWEGDALQLRVISDPSLAGPLAAEKLNSEAIVHLTMWQFTAAGKPVLDVRYGMDFHGAKTLVGAASGLVYKAVPGGYNVEGRLPWALLGKAPAPGAKWRLTLQPLWGDAQGKMQHNFYDVVSAAGFQFQRTDGWGEARFVASSAAGSTLAAQAKAEIARLAPKNAASRGIPVVFNVPKKGFVSVAICKPGGEIVRTLLTKAPREAGKCSEAWDGKDDDGKPAPPGDYVLKALVHDGIKPRFVASVMNSGNPSWGNSGGKYGWGADHGVPIGAACDGEGNTYLLWTFNEGGDYLIQVDATGQKQWGARISWGDFNGDARAVAYDDGLLYVAKDGTGKAGEPCNGGLFVYEAKTGKRVNFAGGAGKLPVTTWDAALLKDAKHPRGGELGANLNGVAASAERIFCALTLEDKILALDKKTGQVAATYSVPSPIGLAFNRARNLLYAVSEGGVVTIDAATGAVSPLLNGLDKPYGVALDAAGQVYVSCRGAAMQVRVFDASGKALRRVGKDGGRPAVGRFDAAGLFQPAGVAVDARGLLWVSEADATPKRISLWDAQGALQREFFGAAAYAPMMAPDPQNPEQVYIHNCRFRVDYETGKVVPEATVFRRDWNGTTIPGSEQGYGFMGSTFEVAQIGGRKFAYNGNGGVFAADDDVFKPVFYLGQGFEGMPGMTHQGAPHWASYVWRDANRDGLLSADEVSAAKAGNLDNNIGQFGGTFWPGGVFIKGGKVFRPAGLSPEGVPLYPEADVAPPIFGGPGPATEFKNWLDVWPSLGSDWKDFYLIASEAGSVQEGDGRAGVFRIAQSGAQRWRYSRVAVAFALKAPLAKTGDLYGALRIAGQAQLPKTNGGEVLGIGCYRGYFGFLSEDGLFIDQVGYDNGRGPTPNIDTFFVENFSGYFFKHPRTGKIYLFCGDVDGRILELQGWNSIARFDGALRVTPEQYQAALTAQSSGTQGAAKMLSVASLTPELDGALGGWDKAAPAEIALDETRSAHVRLAYDDKNLYALFQVPDASPWRNSSDDWRFVFKGGDALDLQLGALWGGEGKRSAQPGDVRVFLAPTPDGNGVRAIAMWAKTPPGSERAPQNYKSPTGEEVFERVALLNNVRATLRKTPGDYTIAAAIPWSELGLKAPEKFAAWQGDVGVLASDGGGTRTTLRRYLFNADTNIVNDIPSEVRVNHANWGRLLFGGAGSGAAVTSAKPRGAALQLAGFAGNSGASGAALLRGVLGRGGGGVAVDSQGRVFTSGGDRVLCLDRDGRAQFALALPQKEWIVGGPNFALAGGYLYFVAGPPVRFEGNYNLLWNPFTLVEPNICRVKTQAEGVSEIVVPRAKFPRWQPDWVRPEISLTAFGNEVFAGYTLSHEGEGRFGVFKVDENFSPLFEVTGKGGRVAADENGDFFIGAGDMVRKFKRAGTPFPGYAAWKLTGLGAVPTGYGGGVMLTPGALWDAGHYGFVGRFARDGAPQPGALSQWLHNLCWVAQIAVAPGGNFYVKSSDALYLAAIENERLKPLRRFGALPDVSALTLLANGYLGIGNARHGGMLWFDFDADDAAAAPVRAEYPGPLAQGFAEGNGSFALGLNPGHLAPEQGSKEFSLLRFAPEPFNRERNHSQNLATIKSETPLVALAKVGGVFFVLDNTRVLRASPDWKTLAPQQTLAAPTALCALDNKTLLVAGAAAVAAYEVTADGLKPLWTLDKWGDDHFGAQLQIAAAGGRLLVSDTTRHRALLFDLAEAAPKFLAQWGATDKPGDDETHLNAPTLCALNGSRAALYDSGNLRVVKLRAR